MESHEEKLVYDGLGNVLYNLGLNVLLLKKLQLDEKAQEYVRNLEVALGRGNEILNELKRKGL